MAASSIKGLKIAVISLGFVLVGGFVFVMASVVNGMGKAAGRCTAFEIALPEGADAEVVQADAGAVAVLLEEADGRRIIRRYDGCSGRPLPEVTVISH